MAFSGGVFTRLYNWVTEQASSPIEIAKLDTQEEDFATGLSNCILRDGTGVPTAATPWNSQRITGLAAATAITDAARASQVRDGSLRTLGSVSGTNTITAAMTPALTSYTAGMIVVFTPANTNTGATTLNIDSLGALDILLPGYEALQGNELTAGATHVLVLDSGGDDWILVNPRMQDWTVPTFSNYSLPSYLPRRSMLVHTSAATHTLTIPANASVPLPVGTQVEVFVSTGSGSIDVAITTDTLIWSPTGGTGTRTVAAAGWFVLTKIESTKWMIYGAGIS